MKYRILSIIAVATLFLTSCYNDDIKNLQQQIDALKGGEIATIETQISSINTSITDLKSVDNTLKEYITALQSDSKKYAQQIADLTAADKNLEGKIADLQKYVDSGIKDTKDWASATFATLDQMDSVATVVAEVAVAVKAISAELDSVKKEVTSGYTKAIEAATTKLETSMKKWVNEQLADYYTMAQIDATLDSISKFQSKVDSAMVEKIEEQKVALDTAKSQLTAAYKEAVKVAIDSLGGKFDTKLATDIAQAKSELNSQIQSIQNSINQIIGRIKQVETMIASLVNRVQSIVVVPNYTDGDVRIQGAASIISFDVRPLSVAKQLVQSAASDSSIFSFKVAETLTKTPAPEPELEITAFAYNEETNFVDITVTADDLPAFFEKTKHYAVSLMIQSGDVTKGGVNKSSSYFNLYPVALSKITTTPSEPVVQL